MSILLTIYPPPYPRSTPWLQPPELGEPCLSFSPSTPLPPPRSTPWLQPPELGEPCLSFSPSTPLPTLGQHHGYSLLNWVNHVYPSHHLPPSLPTLPSHHLPPSTPWLQPPELGEPCLSFSPSTPLPTLGQHHGYSLLNWVNHVYPSHHLP